MDEAPSPGRRLLRGGLEQSMDWIAAKNIMWKIVLAV
jgi:hypothetical protein